MDLSLSKRFGVVSFSPSKMPNMDVEAYAAAELVGRMEAGEAWPDAPKAKDLPLTM